MFRQSFFTIDALTKMSHLVALFCFCMLIVLSHSFTACAQSTADQSTATPIVLSADQIANTDSLSEQDIQAYQDTLQRIRTLVRANVVNLAQQLLIDESPKTAPTDIWFQWQQQLWALYESTENWTQLQESTAGVPLNFPKHMRQYALFQNIQAQIALGQYQQARNALRRQLQQAINAGESVQQLRQFMIESYLQEQRYDDADIAMQLYENEYRNNDANWNQLRARILIQKQQYEQAVRALAEFRDPMSDLIKLQARLLSGNLSPAQVQKQLAVYLEDEKSSPALRFYAFDISVQAAQQTQDANAIAVRLEQNLAFLINQQNAFDSPNNGNIIRVQSALIAQYTSIAQQQANAANLFLDDSNKLYQLVQKQNTTVVKRALLAQILRQQSSLELLVQASDSFVASLLDDDLTALIPSFFQVSDSGLGKLRMNAKTHLELINTALTKDDLSLAGFVSEQVKGVPEGVNEDLWLLQNARIAILTNKIDIAQNYLNQWFVNIKRPNSAQADQVMQALFDLQKINRHDLALNYFQRLYRHGITPRHQREISFWIAESFEANKEFAKAADYYLASAMMQNNGFDQWGDAARYRAADCLLNLGLYEDARNLFEDLLKRTDNAQRSNQLKQKLQDLQLLQSTGTKSEKS